MERKENLIIGIEISDNLFSDIFNQESVISQFQKIEEEARQYLEKCLKCLKSSREFYEFTNSQEVQEGIKTVIQMALLKQAIEFSLKYPAVPVKKALLRVLTEENFKQAVKEAIKNAEITAEDILGIKSKNMAEFL